MQQNKTAVYFSLILFLALLSLEGCQSKNGVNDLEKTAEIIELPVSVIDTLSADIINEYASVLEGRDNVDIRPQVNGYLEKIFIEEGSYVKTGDPLFKIVDQAFREQYNRDLAVLRTRESELASAVLEVDRITPLVKNKVVSQVQLKDAEIGVAAAKSGVEEARAVAAVSKVNLGFTLIKAPIDGYIGRIPKRIGNLVRITDTAALTTLSDIRSIYAYFSMNENDFLNFSEGHSNVLMQKRLQEMPKVELRLSNGSFYEQKGRIGMIDGQFNRSTGAISLRAVFPNPKALLRSGNTGKVRIFKRYSGVIAIPQAATVELQDKTMAFKLSENNAVSMVEIFPLGSNGDNFLINKGLDIGERIVSSGVDKLSEGMVIKPAVLK